MEGMQRLLQSLLIDIPEGNLCSGGDGGMYSLRPTGLLCGNFLVASCAGALPLPKIVERVLLARSLLHQI
jgi:hypothetical protein